MYKITFVTEPEFKINKDKRTVACYAKIRINGLSNHFRGFTKGHDYETENYDIENFILGDLYSHGLIPYNYPKSFFVSAVAKCSNDDVFNESLGKHIAETKLRVYIYNIMRNINCSALKYIKQLEDRCTDAVIKTKFLLDRENNHLKELIDETY